VNGPHTIGSCCTALGDALNRVPGPVFRVGGVDEGFPGESLILAVGSTEDDNGQLGWFEIVVPYCPFCGTQLLDSDTLA
jgi:hypothetical protein